jgi:phytoene desaturase
MSSPIVIIGAGVGGLATAIYLSRQGHRVVVLEKNQRIGGKLNIIQEKGYTFDTGPTLFTMPWIVRDLFAAANRNQDDYFEIAMLEPLFRCYWPDGKEFEVSQCFPTTVRELEKLTPEDVPNYFRFVAHIADIYKRVAGPFLFEPFSGLRDFLRPQLVSDGLRIDAFQSVYQVLERYFRSPHLRQVFSRYPTYNGSSPYEAPGTFNVIAYVELVYGGWYVRGGMYQLARALQRVLEELGVEIRTSSEVSEIIVQNGAATGVRLTNGEEIESACVVANSDPHYTYKNLLPGQEKVVRSIERLQPSASGFIMLLGIDKIYDQLRHHTLFFNEENRHEFDSIFGQGIPATNPSIYACTTSVSDPSLAPEGGMNMFLLINAPSLNGKTDWDKETQAYGDAMIRKLEERGLPDLSNHIVVRKVITPLDMYRHYNAAYGSIYGVSSNSLLSAFLRPSMRSRTLKRLYFVGGGTHPGGGIPMVILSGKTAAQHIASDANIPQPEAPPRG